jgi:AraC-like DNA-binding protein
MTYPPEEKRPDSIIYQITYLDPGSREIALRLTRNIKVSPPYEHLLDCKNFRDMDFYVRALIFRADSIETLGLEWDFRGIPVMLDRTLEFKTKICSALYKPGKRPLDQFLNETGHQSFESQNNRIAFKAVWDMDSLYLSFDVDDTYLNCVDAEAKFLGRARNYFLSLWLSDGIEICFDIFHDRNEWKSLDDFELLASVNNEKQGNTWDLKKKEMRHWGKSVRMDLTVRGTLNQNSDTDTGYTIVFAVPWKELKHTPRAGDTIGFDVQMFDKDIKSGHVFRSFWSGAELSNNDNPSEWGNLVLAGKAPSNIWLISILVILVGIVLLILFLRSKSKGQISGTQGYSKATKQAIAYIKENFGNEAVTVEEIARVVGLSKTYFSTLFKNETRKAASQFLTEIRIEKACGLLRDTNQSISEVAYAVGFSDQSHFTKVFKKIKNVTPFDFRKNG